MFNNESLGNLKPFKGKWQHRPTKTIKIPVVFAEQLMGIAEQLDVGNKIDDSPVTNELKDIIAKIEEEASGYKLNSSRQLINRLLAMKNMIN